GTPVERAMLHWRKGGTVDDDGPDAGGREAARQGSADRPRPHDANIRPYGLGHCGPMIAVTDHRDQETGNRFRALLRHSPAKCATDPFPRLPKQQAKWPALTAPASHPARHGS